MPVTGNDAVARKNSATHCLPCLQVVGNKRNGNLRWKLPMAERFIFKGKERVYVMGPRKEIWAIDEMSGATLGRYPTNLLQFVLTNTKDEYIYVANASGHVFCLKESRQTY